MFFFAARQPILDQNKNVFAYELLFRDSLENSFPNIEADLATQRILEASRVIIGINDITNDRPAFINFTSNTLFDGLPELLEAEDVIIELLENIEPTSELLEICKNLHKKGYSIALDDYVHSEKWVAFFPYIKIIKLDIKANGLLEINRIIQAKEYHRNIIFLAEKVESYEDYKKACDNGCTLFQGYFFAQPEIIKAKEITPSSATLYELLSEATKEDIDLNKLCKTIERDISLTYKLLRYANSPLYKKHEKISSIKQALVMLGEHEIKKFIGLIFATNINKNKPPILIEFSLVRAKFCELMMHRLNGSGVRLSTAFLTGFLSLIDAILDQELVKVLEDMHLSDDITHPLVTKKGVLALLIYLIEAVERAHWSRVSQICGQLSIQEQDLEEVYIEAITWAAEA